MSVIQALSRVAPMFPELRTMQLIFNALDLKGLARNPNGTARDQFYLADDVLEDAIYSYGAFNCHKIKPVSLKLVETPLESLEK